MPVIQSPNCEDTANLWTAWLDAPENTSQKFKFTIDIS